MDKNIAPIFPKNFFFPSTVFSGVAWYCYPELWENWRLFIWRTLRSLLCLYVTYAQATVIKHRLLRTFFAICSQLAFFPRFSMLLDFAHVVSLSCKKFVHMASFSGCALVLNIKRIDCYSLSHLWQLYISLWRNNWVIKLCNCSISSFRFTVIPSKFIYACSICSLVFRWRKCCEAQLRLCLTLQR